MGTFVFLREMCWQRKHGTFRSFTETTQQCFAFFFNSANKCRAGEHNPVNTYPLVISALHKDIFLVLRFINNKEN